MKREETRNKLNNFEQLLAWQEARKFARDTYLLTNTFPKEELFALTSQMRRSSTSISANIAEGFSRQTIANKLHFYTIAAGSLTELQSFSYIAMDVGYISSKDRICLRDQCVITHKLLSGLIKSTRRRTFPLPTPRSTLLRTSKVSE